MKKKVLLVLLAFTVCFISCMSTRPAIDNSVALKDHQKPYKVFSIGYWKPGYSIITLKDARQEYFTIKTLKNDSLKVGDIYYPSNLIQTNME